MRSNDSSPGETADLAVILGPDDHHRQADVDPATPVLLADRTEFSDGEHLVTLPDVDLVRGRHVLVVQTTSPPQGRRLLSLLQLVDIATSAGAASVTCCTPYLCYQRQDRRTLPGEALTARVVLRSLGALGVLALITVDRHSELTRLPGEVPVVNLNCAERFADFTRSGGLRPEIVLSPDAGGARRAERVAGLLDLPFVAMRKLKRPDIGTYYETVPDEVVGRRCLVVEDLCSSGTTLVPLCDWLEPHVSGVDVLVSHILTSVETIADRLPLVDVIGYSDSCGDPRAPIRALGPAVDAWHDLVRSTDRTELDSWSRAT